jgi:hypothetical protein
MGFEDKRRAAICGGLLAGIGLGALLAWLLDIFEVAHPLLRGLTSAYPNMALTAFAVLVFCSTLGVGLGLVASALIRDGDMRQATAADPSDAARSQKSRSAARTIFGLGRPG